ncbi:MAG: endonuclease/exonuclease/phosphatase family protein [Paracoccaceae bacterium]|uniref:endonuclease/exonuclease/phosphatase family protein n=1 Tax=Seohaeicola saemankumensis TaxID=481181 RepID=UPI001E2E9A10|nr:endonuclease/exonuclease/phosphatase family protein [Seohaeicola saemankumensis]MCD1624596.1 endonuclease/exonuclease/phosphatase family protein [Seohaeicola saemankumensis]
MSASQIRIASYNLQKCVGLDLRRRPDRSLKVIEGLRADLVVLQEADKRLPPRPAALPHGMIEDDGWQIVPVGTGGHRPGASLGWHGNAMLIRPHLRVLATAHLDLPGLEPRGAIRVDLETGIGPLRVIGLHLGLIRRYRLLQMAAVMRCLRELPHLPTVIAGDFNEWKSVMPLDTIAQGLRFMPGLPSFPAARPVAKLDRFALSEDLQMLEQGAYIGHPARVASDHLPVWADLGRSGADNLRFVTQET